MTTRRNPRPQPAAPRSAGRVSEPSKNLKEVVESQVNLYVSCSVR